MLDLMPLSARPDFARQIFSAEFRGLWPEFTMHDPGAELFFEDPWFEANRRMMFAVVDPAAPELAIGRCFAVTFARRDVPGRETLPDRGWDEVIRWAHADRAAGRAPDAMSALEITLRPSFRGRGASRIVLDALRHLARDLGCAEMFAPVRPTAKHLEPFTPMSDYVARTTPDGLPADPWLRVHLRAGGRIERIAPASMVIAAGLDDWRRWTGLPLDASGPVAVPGALVPVQVSLEGNSAVYVEPNVWVRHVVP